MLTLTIKLDLPVLKKPTLVTSSITSTLDQGKIRFSVSASPSRKRYRRYLLVKANPRTCW